MNEPLTENERALALSAWAQSADSMRWGNLVLLAYDGQTQRLAESERVRRLLAEAAGKHLEIEAPR